ncbi:methyltransferase domain-containing protein [Bradyrhizobium sp. SZCCHNS2005]|uniref:methyltransferase domain-containing protein n=1 Tax=Bradyrhizobium sp. SZCCHNS2005 TaxID=3057303 RepID=UPI0028E3F833|nr:methyltransferase domain-containing protein [Bradyrhizobium sp. SZCCHNS2005]
MIEVGAQQLSNAFLRSHDLISECYRLFGKQPVSLGEPIETDMVNGIEHQSEDNPSSRQFWRSLGFTYAALEFDGHRDSTPLDLNRDSVPRRMRAAFDLVVNTGTTEHVANQANAFKVMHDLCKPGGIMYHILPAGGMMTHGLITYTPKFFWHLSRENDYQIVWLKFVSHHPINPVPQNIRDSNIQFSGIDLIPADHIVPDFMVIAAIRKPDDSPFVTPLDVPPEVMPKKKPKSRSLKQMVAAVIRSA